jgi:hypothetical protein
MAETIIWTDHGGVGLVIRDDTYFDGVFVSCAADEVLRGPADEPYSRGEQILPLLYGPLGTNKLDIAWKTHVATLDGKELQGTVYYAQPEE